MIAAVLLAAGASRRFGAPKLLQPLAGKTVLRWAAESAAGVADELVVVVPSVHDPLRTALDGMAARLVVNERAADGMGSSLACGIAALGDSTTAALVALGDEPLLPRRSHERVLARYRAGGALIVAATYGGARGHPVLFDRAMFPELRVLSGDHGARAVVDRDAARVAFVEMGEAHPVDVDTPADLARVARAAQL